MVNVSLRLRVLIGVAVVLAVLAAVRLIFFGGDGADARQRGPDFARIQRHRREKNVAALSKEVARPDEKVARWAVEAMGQIGPEAMPQITQAMDDRRERVREKAATAFSQVARHDQAAPLARLARDDESPNVRAAAVSGLSRLFAFEEMETLLAAMDDPDLAVRRRASKAATRIACVAVGYKAEDPPAKRRAAIQRMRAHWQKEKESARQYWNMILEHRAAKKRP
jgi:hypothetical protein